MEHNPICWLGYPQRTDLNRGGGERILARWNISVRFRAIPLYPSHEPLLPIFAKLRSLKDTFVKRLWSAVPLRTRPPQAALAVARCCRGISKIPHCIGRPAFRNPRYCHAVSPTVENPRFPAQLNHGTDLAPWH
jgi:hypothetical protein